MQTILIVEDNAAHTALASVVLESAHYAVLRAATAEEGLYLAHEHCPDLILQDVQLPGMDGWAALRALRADPSTCAMKVIMVSSFDADSTQARAMQAGADACLTKPYHYGDLLATVSDLLAPTVMPAAPKHTDAVLTR